MTTPFARRLSLLLAALTVLLTGLTMIAYAQDEEPVDLTVYETGDIEVAIEPTGENGYCTICHNQPNRTHRLEDGTLLNLYVAPELLASSVHGPSEDSPGLGCLDCHGEDSFPHVGLPPSDGRAYTINANNMCVSCHENVGQEMNTGLHAQAIVDGNPNAAVCTDCHDAHHIQSAEFRPEIMSGVCGDCHGAALAEWQISDHADIGPLGCATCHDYHAQTLRVGETTTDLCLNCHEDNLPDLFVHDTHITAVQGADNPVECADCHMYTGDDAQLVSTDATEVTGHSMLLDATPCDTCHTELVSSGEWETILAERVGLDAAPTGDEMMEEAAQIETEAAETRNNTTRFAIQGLLLGLGLGVTFAIVFITRNRTQPAQNTEEA